MSGRKQHYKEIGTGGYLKNKHGATPIPKNFFVMPDPNDYDKRHKKHKNVFKKPMPENHQQWEQFFWTRDTVERLMEACQYTAVEKTCCLTTPSLAHEWHVNGRDETLLDIDQRFDYLPKFRYYDVTKPEPRKEGDDFRLLILDPPFFIVPIEQFREAVDVLTNKNYNTKILIGFLLRSEKRLREAFKEYNLVPTKFELQYASIKPSKWGNFRLYSNVDLPGIKRIKETHEHKIACNRRIKN